MITVKVTRDKLIIDGHAEGDRRGVGICAVCSFVGDALELWGCPARLSDGYSEVDLPPPGDPVREFVVAALAELARKVGPNRLEVTVALPRGADRCG